MDDMRVYLISTSTLGKKKAIIIILEIVNGSTLKVLWFFSKEKKN
jgi:hypothetical protein